MVKISTNIKNFIETITKGLSYTKTEIDTKLANKANTNHTHDIASLPDETDMLGHMENDFYTALDTKANKTTATTSANGLMSKEDKSKLDGIATEANKTIVDSALSTSSTNPVQNKVVNSALNGKANSSHTHSINDVTGLSTSLDGKMNNDYSESTIESNFFAHKIGNIVIVTWWGMGLPTTQNCWIDWKTLPYESCNTKHIWVNGDGDGCEVRVRVPPNSNKLQVLISGGTGGIRPGMIVYPTK